MGFIRNIFKDIKEKKQIKTMEEYKEFMKIKEKELIDKLYSDDGYSIGILKEEYEDVLKQNNFVFSNLKNGNWRVLDLLDDEQKESEIRHFSDWASRNNHAAERNYADEVIIKYREAIKYFPNSLFEDKEFIKHASYLYPNLISEAPQEIKRDKEFVKELLLWYGVYSNISDYLDKEVIEDREFILDLAKEKPSFLIIFNNLDKDLFAELYKENPHIIRYSSKEFLMENTELFLDYIDNHYPKLLELNYGYEFHECKKLIDNFKELLKEDKQFCLEVIDRGFLEYYSSMGEFKRDPDILRAIVDKFQEFDASNDYDIERIAQYPSKLKETFDGINFSNERKLLEEKVIISDKKESNEEKIDVEL